MVWCDSQTGYQKDMCLIKIGLHAQNTISIRGSIVIIIIFFLGGVLYGHLTRMGIFTLVMNMIFIQDPKIMRKVGTTSIWIC